MIKPQFPSGYAVWIDGVEVPKDDVLSVEFEDGLALLDELKVTIRNDRMKYTKERNALRGKPIKAEGGWIGREWGSIFNGKIYSANPEFNDDGFTLELAAMPVSISDGWHKKRTAEHTASSVPEMIKNVVLSTHPGMSVLYQVGKSALLTRGIIQDGETDWEFCKRLAHKAAGLEFTIKNNTAIIRESKPTDSPVVTFEYGANVSSLKIKESDLEKKVESDVAREGDDNSTTMEHSTVATETQRKLNPYAALEIENGFMGELPTAQIYEPLADDAEALDTAAGSGKSAATDEILLNIIALGTIKAVAGKTCLVKGYGCYDGKYYIRKVVHRFKGDYLITVEASNKQASEGEKEPGGDDDYA